MIRAALDANVYASALIRSEGPSSRITVLLVERDAFAVVLSPAILEEVRRCLAYPRVRRRIRATDDEIERWLATLILVANMVPGTFEVGAVTTDSDDNKYLAAALEGRADVVVTGDGHLLVLKEYQGVRIVTPAVFLKILLG